jgi:hypothetical protein
MWIFLKDSFLSIVDKGDDTHKTLLVRARYKGDIERVFPGATVEHSLTTDYHFRARIDRDFVADAIAESVRSIDYGNFKNTVTNAQRHNAYLGVWYEMFKFQKFFTR